MNIGEAGLDIARQVTSPNCDERPIDEISLVVIHCISLPAGHFGTRYVEALFCNDLDCVEHPDFADLMDLRVSSHLFVRRNGEVIQFVPFEKRAWHAGQSTFNQRSQCNDFSVGIELEGIDTGQFTDVQYRLLGEICREMQSKWMLEDNFFVGHSDIAPGRKTDPGSGFDWQRFRQSLQE